MLYAVFFSVVVSTVAISYWVCVYVCVSVCLNVYKGKCQTIKLHFWLCRLVPRFLSFKHDLLINCIPNKVMLVMDNYKLAAFIKVVGRGSISKVLFSFSLFIWDDPFWSLRPRKHLSVCEEPHRYNKHHPSSF